MGDHFPVREKSKYWKGIEKIIKSINTKKKKKNKQTNKKYYKNVENTGKVRQFCQSEKVGNLNWYVNHMDTH